MDKRNWIAGLARGKRQAGGVTRRRVMKLFGGGSLLVVACGGGSGNSDPDAGADPVCEATPVEGTGPFPDMVGGSVFDRSAIAEDRPGLPVRLTLTLVDISRGCAALSGARVMIWQCDAEGHYSEYANQFDGYDGTGTTYLRGAQLSDAGGKVSFSTIYPGWYDGRATHIHVEVFVGGVSGLVTQLAFPDRATAQVHVTGVYAARGLNPLSNAEDLIFFDTLDGELLTLTGDPSTGYLATATIAVGPRAAWSIVH